MLSEAFLISFIFFRIVWKSIFDKENSSRQKKYLYALLYLCITITIITFITLFFENNNEFYYNIRINNSTTLIKLLILIFSSILILLRIVYNDFSINPLFSYPSTSTLNQRLLYSFLILSSCLMIERNDFIIFFLVFEIQRFSLYILAASKKNLLRSTEASLKYFILGGVSSIFFLFGIRFFYLEFGTTNWNEIEIIANYNLFFSNYLLIGIIFVTRGFLFKLPAAPLHIWAPDVYRGVSKNITAFFIILPKFALLRRFVNLLFRALYVFREIWTQLLLICSILSIFFGSLGAYLQINLKRFLAYRTIVHVGWILLGLSCARRHGVGGRFLYLIIYAITTVMLFILIMCLNYLLVYYNKLESVLKLRNMGHFFFYAIIWTLSLFSLAGVPPLAGFFIKFIIILEVIKENNISIALFLILFSTLSAYYYIRIIRILFFNLLESGQYYEIESNSKQFLLIKTACYLILFLVILNFFIPLFAVDFLKTMNITIL